MEMTIVVVNAPFHQSWYLSIHHPSRPVLLWIIWEIHWQYWMMGRLVGLCPRLLLLLPPLIWTMELVGLIWMEFLLLYRMMVAAAAAVAGAVAAAAAADQS